MAGKRRTLYLNNDDEWNQFKALAKPSPSAVISDFVRSYIGTDKAAPQPKKPKRNIDLQVIKELCESHAWFQVLWNYQPERWRFHLDLDPAGWVEHIEAVYGCCDLILESESAIDYLSAKGLVRTNIIIFQRSHFRRNDRVHVMFKTLSIAPRFKDAELHSQSFKSPKTAAQTHR